MIVHVTNGSEYPCNAWWKPPDTFTGAHVGYLRQAVLHCLSLHFPPPLSTQHQHTHTQTHLVKEKPDHTGVLARARVLGPGGVGRGTQNGRRLIPGFMRVAGSCLCKVAAFVTMHFKPQNHSACRACANSAAMDGPRLMSPKSTWHRDKQ